MTDEPRTYPPGVPCWVDLETPDPDAAMRFYGGLFGWEFHNAMPAAAPGAYYIATLDGADAAAIAPGEDPGWISYIATSDADAAADAVVRAGGTIVDPPEDAGPGGRLATCTDTQGARFRVWQAYARAGAQVVNVPGAWNFSDLHAPDPAAAERFYSATFGWAISPDSGAGMFRLPGYGAHLAATVDPGILERQEFAPDGFEDVIAGFTSSDEASQWWIRFTVESRDAAVETVERLGGAVVSSTETEWTHEAVVADPSGARFIVSQLVPPE